MMTPECTWTHGQLADLMDRTLASHDRVRAQTHLLSCPGCQADLDSMRLVVAGLNELPSPVLPQGFSQRLSARIRQESAHLSTAIAPRPSRLLTWFSRLVLPPQLVAGGAVAAMLALTLWSGPFAPEVTPPTDNFYTLAQPSTRTLPAVAKPVAVGVGSDAVVRIWFRADRAVDDVQFTLSLPSGVRLVQNGQMLNVSSLTWQGRLEPGRNLIPFHVRGIANGKWTMKASMAKGSSRQERAVDLQVDGV